MITKKKKQEKNISKSVDDENERIIMISVSSTFIWKRNYNVNDYCFHIMVYCFLVNISICSMGE